jgi:uncharacterized protein YuzE
LKKWFLECKSLLLRFYWKKPHQQAGALRFEVFQQQRGGEILRFIYDPRYNIAYLRFGEKRTGVETIRVSDELNVDLSPDGTIYGIELLNAMSSCAVRIWESS